MRPLTILCDMDAILVDLGPAWFAALNARLGTSLSVANVTSWDVAEFLPPDLRKESWEPLSRPGFYRHLPAISGAVDAVAELRAAGHRVVIVSSPPIGDTVIADKTAWCERELGMRRKDMVWTSQKDLVAGDVLIDDSPANIAAYRARWPESEVMSIAYPYNGESAHLCTMFTGWQDTRAAWRGMVDRVRTLAAR